MRPLIGITCDQDQNRFWVTRYYGEAIAAIGGIPILLPVTIDESLVTAYGILLDGLLLTGGEDLNPQLFGEEPIRGLGPVTPNRDLFELALCKGFLTTNKPILGICRGLQVLNVSAGGTLFQDLASQLPESVQHRQQAPKNHPSHRVIIDKSSLLQGLVKASMLLVNSFHHQAIKSSAPGFREVAWASDGVIEALERETGFALGVQWHPEHLWREQEEQRRLFTAFINASKMIKSNKGVLEIP